MLYRKGLVIGGSLLLLIIPVLFSYNGTVASALSDDVEPPHITDISFSGTLTTGDTFRIYVTVSDDINVSSVWLVHGWSASLPASWTNLSLTRGTNNYSATLVNPSGSKDPLWYRIDANDTSDNWANTPWSFRSVTDNDPPTFLSDLSSENATTGDPFTFSAVMDDNVGILLVAVNITYNFHRFYSYNMSGSGNSRQLQIILPSDAREVLYYWYYFTDGSGNSNESTMFNRSMIDNDPPVLMADLTKGPATTGEWFEMGFIALDNWGIDKAWVRYEMIGLSSSGPVNYSLGRFGNNFTHVIKMPINWAGVMNYSASFMDTSGNLIKGKNASIVTLDNDPPGLASDLTNRIGTTGENVTFSIRPKDNVKVAEVFVQYTVYGKTVLRVPMHHDPISQLFNYTIRAPEDEEGSIGYYINITDERGNGLNTEPQLVHIFDNDPPYMIYENSDSYAGTGEIFTFRAAFRDNVGMDQVEVHFSYPDDEGTIKMKMVETLSKGGIYEGYMTVLPDASGVLSYTYTTTDERSNVMTSRSYEVEIVDVILPEIVDVRFIDNRTSEGCEQLTTGDVYTLEMDVKDNKGTTGARYRFWSMDGHFDATGPMSMGLRFEDRRIFFCSIEVPSNLTGEVIYELSVTDSDGTTRVKFIGSILVEDDDPPEIWEIEYTRPVPLVGWLEVSFSASDNIGITEVKVYFPHNDTILNFEASGNGSYRFGAYHFLDSLNGLRLQLIVSDGNLETRVPLLIEVYDNLPPFVLSSLTESSRYPDDRPIQVVANIFDHSGWELYGLSVVNASSGFEIVDYEVSPDMVTFSFFPPEPGKWVLQMTVMDQNGLYTYLRRNFTIYDNTPPYFQVRTPNGTVKGDIVNLSVTDVSDHSEIAWIEWTILGPGGEVYNFQDLDIIEFRTRSAGSYKVTVSLKDGNGNKMEKTVWFNVEENNDGSNPVPGLLVLGLIILTVLTGIAVLIWTFKDRILSTLKRFTGENLSEPDQ
ncbi:MAG: hypothetical protein JXA22_07410 [Candidatus Thermoplasmatota archaeon]|nr:hypothetical protein [Candidatus Thermoplasmatota archaeon]